MIKKCNCPKCEKELTRLEPFEKEIFLFWCDDCNVNITIEDNNENK